MSPSMIIEPAGRERDIQILKLKGWSEEILAPKYWACDSKIALKRMDGDLICPDCHSTLWSTNRNDAWELWDELIKTKEIGLQFYEDDEKCILQMNTQVIEGKDFADCVSRAWITWKTEARK